MKARVIGFVLVAIIIASVISVIIFVGPIEIASQKKEDDFKNWNKSGPFATLKKEYKIGENVFFVGAGLNPSDKGDAIFVLPNGTSVYLSLPFDGKNKPDFNYYFKPSLSNARKICSTDDIIGTWTIIFEGTPYLPIKFDIINKTLEGELGYFERIC